MKQTKTITLPIAQWAKVLDVMRKHRDAGDQYGGNQDRSKEIVRATVLLEIALEEAEEKGEQ